MIATNAAARAAEARLFTGKARLALAETLSAATGWDRTYAGGALTYKGAWIVSGRRGRESEIAIGFEKRPPRWATPLSKLPKAVRDLDGMMLWVFRAVHEVCAALRDALPFLSPQPVGSRPSFGFGDRTGLAMPGHVAALKGSKFFPVFAQQSIREMGRTQRTPDEVMDAATFGALQCGYTKGFGADADHLKTAQDIDRTAAAGFVMFTLDSADVIVNPAGKDDAQLDAEYGKVLAEVPEARKWEKQYAGKTFTFRGRGAAFAIEFDAATWRAALVKFGRVVIHSAELAARVKRAKKGRPFEIEIAVDETPVDTTLADHVFIVRELKKRGVAVAAFAAKFVGDFEKGVDYKGDKAAFERSMERHDAVARAQGGYKLSVHSGSDKFSIYPAIARATRGRFHLKTAGTSWMEAVRTVCRKDPALFREMVDFAREQFRKDRASYHISGAPDQVPPPTALRDADLERVYVVEDAGRQIMHVTYGSLLTARTEQGWRFRDRILDLLVREEETHHACLARHFGRHLAPLRGR